MAILALKKSIDNELKEHRLKTTSHLKPVPDNIEDFARLIEIRSGDRLVSFELYEHQKVFLQLLEDHQYVLGVKSRQMGATQVAILYFLYKAIGNPAYSALIFSKTQEDTSLLAFRCKEMIKSLDGYIALDNENLKTIRVTGGGVLYFRNSKIDGARGIDSVSDILYDEAAFVDDIDKIYSAASPTQRMTGEKARTIVLSTPNGVSGWYFDRANGHNPDDKDLLKMCELVRKQAIAPIQSWTARNGWAKFIAHWRCHPIYGQNDNYLQEIADREDMPREQVNQEYDLSFTDSAEKRFTFKLIESVCIGEWEKQKVENAEYYLAFDPQFGGSDFAVAGVFKHDLKNGGFSLVDWYRKRESSKLTHLIHVSDLIKKYNPEKLVIETNGGGIHFHEDFADLHSGLPIECCFSTQEKKLNQADKLEIAFEKKELILPNNKIIKSELLDFEKKDKKLSASDGKHDDIVMMIMIATTILPFYKKPIALDFDRVKTIQKERTYEN